MGTQLVLSSTSPSRRHRQLPRTLKGDPFEQDPFGHTKCKEFRGKNNYPGEGAHHVVEEIWLMHLGVTAAWLLGWQAGWQAGWLVDCLASWLAGWLAGWLIG